MSTLQHVWPNSIARRLGLFLRLSATHSLTLAFGRGLGRMVTGSLTARAVCWLLGRDGPSRYSWLAGLLQLLNHWLACMGAAMGRAYHKSLLGRLTGALRWRTACEHSLLAFSPRKAVLFFFALYLPVDVIFRDVLGFMGLGSIWDKAFLVLGFVVVLIDRMRTKKETAVTALDIPLLFLMAVGIYLWIVNAPGDIGFTGLRAVVQNMLWFFVISRLLTNRRDIYLFILAFVALGTVISLHGIYQFIVAEPIPDRKSVV